VQQHRPALALALLGHCLLLCLKHEQMFDLLDRRVVHQPSVARLRTFERFHHGQERFATPGEHPVDLGRLSLGATTKTLLCRLASRASGEGE